MGAEVEVAMGADHHDDVTDTRGCTKGTDVNACEEVHGADGARGKQVEVVAEEKLREDSDEGGVGMRACARIIAIATEIRKGMVWVGNDGRDEQAAEQVEMASDVHVDEHDDAKRSEQDAE